jgi:hypothetical protein
MDNTPFRFDVLNVAGKKIGHVVWDCPGNKWRAYRYAGQPPIGVAETKAAATQIVVNANKTE